MASPTTQPGLIRFGPFALDPTSRELRKRGHLIRLQPQQIAVLLLLTERAGQIVSREEIHQHIWGDDTFVDFERGINFSINQIRAALGDDADKPRYVETIPRRGYRFICPVEVSEGPLRPSERHESAASTNGPDVQSSPLDRPLTLETETADAVGAALHPPSTGIRGISRKWLLSGIGIGLLGIAFFAEHAVNRSLRIDLPWLGKAKTLAGRARTIALTSFRGFVCHPVFSPDGKQVAYFWNGKDQNREEIYVQMIGGDQPLQLTHTRAGFIYGLAWSPDGRQIAFGRCANGFGGIYTVPVLGGAEHKLTDVACVEVGAGEPQWTLDGKSMLFGDRCVPNGPYGIVVFSLATGQKHCLTAPLSNNAMDVSLDLSPDGKTVSFIRSTTPGVGEIYVVPLKGGSPRRLTTDGSGIQGTMWAADGKRIIFNSNRGGMLSDRLWQVPSGGGEIEPERVYSHLGALSRDGRRLAYEVDAGGQPPSVWRAELSGPGGHVVASKKVLASVVSDGQPQLSPDQSKIAFVSFRSGNFEIWRSDADGGNPLQLTSFGGENAGTPRWSPNGKWIAFDRRPEAHSQVYAVDVDGRNLHALTDGDFDNSVPSWSRDGRSIYFGSMRSGEWQLWKQKLDGGRAIQITQHGGFTAFESFDGKTLYYTRRDEEGIWSIPMGGGAETRLTAAPHVGYWGHWAVSETGLYLLEDDILPQPAIEFYDFNTGKLKPVLQLEYSDVSQSPGLDASRDGRTLLFVQFQPQSSLAMVENLQ